jgi:AcrR family transcriptional regulator
MLSELMATRRLTRSEKQEVTRKAILKSASALFARNGVEGTSMEEIARHAGLTQGAIYSNFKSKSDLWWAIADQISRTVRFEDVFTGNKPLRDELRDAGRLGARIVRGANKTELLLNQEFNVFLMRHPRARARGVAELRESAAEMGAKLEGIAAKRDEKLPMSGERLALVMSALADGLVQYATLDPSLLDEEFCGEAFALLAGCDANQ